MFARIVCLVSALCHRVFQRAGSCTEGEKEKTGRGTHNRYAGAAAAAAGGEAAGTRPAVAAEAADGSGPGGGGGGGGGSAAVPR